MYSGSRVRLYPCVFAKVDEANWGDAMKPMIAHFSGRASILLFLCVAAISLYGCATQPLPGGSSGPGFFLGLLHGFVVLFSFIASLFTDYRIYAYPNSGGWYDFGFLLGAMSFFGGGGAGACKGTR